MPDVGSSICAGWYSLVPWPSPDGLCTAYFNLPVLSRPVFLACLAGPTSLAVLPILLHILACFGSLVKLSCLAGRDRSASWRLASYHTLQTVRSFSAESLS